MQRARLTLSKEKNENHQRKEIKSENLVKKPEEEAGENCGHQEEKSQCNIN